MTEPTQSEPAFQPQVSKLRQPGFGGGPDWSTDVALGTLDRIRSSASVEEAHVQATVEVAMLLHSIRRILIWTAVIIPAALVVLGIVLALALGDSPTTPTSRYSYP